MQTVQLTRDEWIHVINLLGDHPFKIVQPLLLKIGMQLTAQDQAAANPSSIAVGNGQQEAHHE